MHLTLTCDIRDTPCKALDTARRFAESLTIVVEFQFNHARCRVYPNGQQSIWNTEKSCRMIFDNREMVFRDLKANEDPEGSRN